MSIASKFKAIRTLPATPITPVRRFISQTDVAREFVLETPMSLDDKMSVDNVDTSLNDIEMKEPSPSRTIQYPQSGWGDDDDHVPITEESPIKSKRTRDETPSTITSHPSKKQKTAYKPHVPHFRSKAFLASEVMFPPENKDNPDSEPDEFVMCKLHPSLGERQYVQSMMRRYLSNPDDDRIDFRHNNKLRTVWTLYPERILAKHQAHLVLAFDTDSTSCQVFKAERGTLSIPQEEPSSRQRQDHKNNNGGVIRFGWDEGNPFTATVDTRGDWDFLEKWNHMENDTLLPVFGESDDEDATYDRATIREMEEEAAQRAGIIKPPSTLLDLEMIKRVIEEEIEKFEMAWTERKLPKLEKRAYRIYQREKRARTRTRTVKAFREQFKDINERVEGWKGEYAGMQWASVRELRPVCGNLQESINLLKTLQWKIELLTGSPPVKPVKPVKVIESDDKEEMETVEVAEMVDIEVERDDDDEDEEDDLDEVEDEDEGDDLGGFIVDDEDVGMVVEEEMDDATDEVEALDTDNATTGSVVQSSTEKGLIVKLSLPKRQKVLRILETDQSDMEAEDDSILEAVDEEPAPNEPELSPEPPKSATTRSAKGKEPLTDSQCTSLPTPPQDEDVQLSPLVVKEETIARSDTADSVAATIDDYDPDVFVTFGEEEMSQFRERTVTDRETARDFLMRADGKMDRAIHMYYEDPSESQVPEKRRMKKKKRKDRDSGRKRIVVNLEDEDEAPIADVFKPSFQRVLPKRRQLRSLKQVVSDLNPADLREILFEIADKSTQSEFDPMSAFLLGESAEDCATYWSVYRAYLCDMFGYVVDSLDPAMTERFRKQDEFEKFYARFFAYLGIEPPAPSSSKRPSQLAPTSPRAADDLPSSQVSTALSISPKKKSKGKGIDIGKPRPAKPITKSLEEMSQDKELKRIADRESRQRKRGIYMTTTAEGDILINPGKKVTDDAVTFHPRFVAVMKPHQIEGAQYIWKHVCLYPA
jgi:hypothetical protein